MKKSILFLSTSILCASVSQAVVLVNDTFDDGNPGTNPGIGNGFLVGSNGNGSITPTEAGGALTVSSPTNGGRRASFASNDFADTTTAGGALYTFSGINFADLEGTSSGTTRRSYFGVRGNPGIGDFQLNPGLGFYFEVGSADVSTNDTRGIFSSNFFYINGDGTERTTLATFTFDTLSTQGGDNFMNAEINTSIFLNDTGFTFDVTGDTTNSGDPISFAGDFADFGITNTVTSGYASGFNQSEDANLSFSFDAISIEAVPEPSSALLLIGSLSAFALRRRRA